MLPHKMIKQLWKVHSYNIHTTENKKMKIQSIYPFIKQIQFISSNDNKNKVYINDLKNWKTSSKHDDNADSLSMAIRKLLKIG
jgi:phage terminase large subunit-like protein